MRHNFTCSFSIEAVGEDGYLGKYDVMNAAGDIVDGTDEGSVHASAIEALHAAEARARVAVADLERSIA